MTMKLNDLRDNPGARKKPMSVGRGIGSGKGEEAVVKAVKNALESPLMECSMHGAKGEIAAKIVREISLRLKFLNDVGLNYLSLDRSAETLSGGESQRIRLASPTRPPLEQALRMARRTPIFLRLPALAVHPSQAAVAWLLYLWAAR